MSIGQVLRHLWSLRLDVVLAGVFALVLGEVWMRVPFLLPRLEYELDREMTGHLRPEQRGFLWLANISLKSPPVTLNADGHRGPRTDWSKPAIVAVGDSVSFGLGVEDDETWTAALQRRIRAQAGRPDLQVVNASHPGHGPYHMAVVSRRVLEMHRPELLLVRVFIGQRNFHEIPRDEQDSRLDAARLRRTVYSMTRFVPFVVDKLMVQWPSIRASFVPRLTSPDWVEPPHRPAAVGQAMWDSEHRFWEEIATLGRARGVPVVFVVYDADDSPSSAVLVDRLGGIARSAPGVFVMRLGSEAFGIDISDLRSFDRRFNAEYSLRRDLHTNARHHRIVADRTFQFLADQRLLDGAASRADSR